uniref:Uncharacterized protein n=1 Tax=Panagrolaimus sp. JU765 TaxID=591449 RepID=A0AC34QD14_9BILA
LPNQRVDMQFIPSYIRDNVHRQNAVDPQVRYNNIMDEVHHLNFNNEVTKAFGISLNLEPVEKATVLQFDRPDKPKILLGGGKIINPQDDGRFNIGFGRYYRPATIEKWAVLFPSNAPGEEIKAFVDKFTKAAEDRGIQFKSQAKPTQFRGTRFADLRHIFEGFQKEKIHYVLMVDRKSNVASHGILKLVESLYKIVTQQ